MQVFLSPLLSIPFLLLRPKLLVLAVAPVLINFIIFVLAVLALRRFLAQPILDVIRSWWGIGGTLAAVGEIILLVVVVILSGLLTFLPIAPISSPFNDLITERIERELFADKPELLPPPQALSRSVIHSIRDAIARLGFYVPILLFTLLVGLLPVFGPPIAALIGFFNAVMFLSLDAYSYPLDRREMNFNAKLHFLNQHRRIWLPLGFGLAMLLAIPCSIVILPILGSVAATRQYCRAMKREMRALE